MLQLVLKLRVQPQACKQGDCNRPKLENLKMFLHYYRRDLKWINQLEIKS